MHTLILKSYRGVEKGYAEINYYAPPVTVSLVDLIPALQNSKTID
jgi:hypothetical protein